jgi:Xaa-Pro dipeptidase
MIGHRALRNAENKAVEWFDAIVAGGLIRPGIRESQLNQAALDLASDFGFDKHWHKRIVRAGTNTLAPYAENPPDLVIQEDDVVFFDFGPVLGAWEADLGRTYVLGDNMYKHQLVAHIEECWHLAAKHFHATPDITGAQLFAHVCELAAERRWEHQLKHAGHLVGKFPHEQLRGEDKRNYIHPDNHDSMRHPGTDGEPREWILELHFVDRAMGFGAFYEQLLTVPNG